MAIKYARGFIFRRAKKRCIHVEKEIHTEREIIRNTTRRIERCESWKWRNGRQMLNTFGQNDSNIIGNSASWNRIQMCVFIGQPRLGQWGALPRATTTFPKCTRKLNWARVTLCWVALATAAAAATLSVRIWIDKGLLCMSLEKEAYDRSNTAKTAG